METKMSLLKIFLKQKIKSFHHLQHNTLIQSLTSRKARKKKVNIEKGVSCYTQERRNEINEEKLRLHIKTGGGIPPKEGLFPLMQHNTSMHSLALWKDLPFLNVCTRHLTSYGIPKELDALTILCTFGSFLLRP